MTSSGNIKHALHATNQFLGTRPLFTSAPFCAHFSDRGRRSHGSQSETKPPHAKLNPLAQVKPSRLRTSCASNSYAAEPELYLS